MGPRTLVRGNGRCRRNRRHVGHASMGPRTLVRGNGRAGGLREIARLASMGPRTLVRGNREIIWEANTPERLQWGRALSCAEMMKALLDVQERLLLQWGRALSCAEMWPIS